MSRARGRDRRLARAFADAPGLRHRAGRACGGGKARQRTARRCCARWRWATTSATRLTMSLDAFKFREDGHSTHSFGPTFGAAAAAASLVGCERYSRSGMLLSYAAQQASGHLLLDARRGAHREGVRLRRHAGAQRRHRGGDGGARLQRRGRRVLRRAQLLRRLRARPAKPERAGARAWARPTRSCAPTSSAGRWARRSRRRSTASAWI